MEVSVERGKRFVHLALASIGVLGMIYTFYLPGSQPILTFSLGFLQSFFVCQLVLDVVEPSFHTLSFLLYIKRVFSILIPLFLIEIIIGYIIL
jgi:hypothetical protein